MAKTLKKRLDEGQDINKAIDNLNNSYRVRMTRLNNSIKYILGMEFSYFITFTLSNDFITLKQKTIERKIKEALGSASYWVANEDYGSENNRLHYHSLAGYDVQLDYTTILDVYKYGAVNIIPIVIKSPMALKEYLLKQQMHASKQSASKVMRGRGKRTINVIR